MDIPWPAHQLQVRFAPGHSWVQLLSWVNYVVAVVLGFFCAMFFYELAMLVSVLIGALSGSGPASYFGWPLWLGAAIFVVVTGFIILLDSNLVGIE